MCVRLYCHLFTEECSCLVWRCVCVCTQTANSPALWLKTEEEKQKNKDTDTNRAVELWREQRCAVPMAAPGGEHYYIRGGSSLLFPPIPFFFFVSSRYLVNLSERAALSFACFSCVTALFKWFFSRTDVSCNDMHSDQMREKRGGVWAWEERGKREMYCYRRNTEQVN